ncbi:WD40-like Beta Propeller Repeat [Spirosomataceae bacterium TFI 002]|nr:WD40-like Beta Propeller Repeat [Spirosomataceae bacterium TFI 002]
MFVRTIKRIIIVGVLALVSTFTHAQQALLKAADHHFENLSFIKAIDAYESALKKNGLGDTEKLDAKIKLAESYSKIKDTQNAERVLREVVESGASLSDNNVEVYLKYAQALASNGKYQESQKMYDDYTAKVASDPRGKKFSKLYNDVTVLSKNANCYLVDYVTINTNSADFSPTYYQNGLVFVSNRKANAGVRRVFNWNNTPFLDLYHLEDVASLGGATASLGGGGSGEASSKNKKGGSFAGSDEYTPPSANDSRTIGSYGGNNISAGLGYGDKPITESERFDGTINSKYHEGPAAFFKDGQRVIFTRNNFLNGKARKSSDGINKLKLYIANAEKNGWGELAELPFNSDEYSTGHPALSPDEKLLFFASDMPGGYGGTDIYVSRLDGENWSAPINLGSDVNTKGNEMFPFIDEKGNMYFSSDGQPGLGDLDIFFVQVDGVTPKGRVINIGSPINSSKDDFGIVTDGIRQTGYFSSNRKRGGDDDDIYKFERQCELKEGCDLILAIYDADTKMPLDNVTVLYEDSEGNLQEGISDAEGKILITDLADGEEFTFRATREGYTANTVSFSTEGCDNEPSRLEIPLSFPVPEISEETVAENSTNSGSQSGMGNPQTGFSESGYTSGSTSGTGVTCTIRGRVLSQSGGSPLEGVLVTIKSECDGTVQTAYTDLSGFYEFTVQEGCDYTLEGNKDELASNGKKISKLSCAEGGITTDVYMFTSGDVLKVENIYFDYGKCNIRKDARAGLDKIVTLMRQNPDMKIELSAHTDARSEASFNDKISQGRAKASADYLFKRGVSRTRVEYKGYGETQPVNGCVDGVDCTEAQHAQNRRTEIKILQLN